MTNFGIPKLQQHDQTSIDYKKRIGECSLRSLYKSSAYPITMFYLDCFLFSNPFKHVKVIHVIRSNKFAIKILSF